MHINITYYDLERERLHSSGYIHRPPLLIKLSCILVIVKQDKGMNLSLITFVFMIGMLLLLKSREHSQVVF